VILAIDPGLSGSLAIIGGGAVEVFDLPVHKTQHGAKGVVRHELDLHSLKLLLTGRPIEHCIIERVGPMPKQGVTSMFRFGYSAGCLYGLIIGLGLPISFVTPQQWQRHHGIGAAPEAAVQRALQLFPALAASLTRKCDHNRADAALIATYGLRFVSPENDYPHASPARAEDGEGRAG
jgi:crossover junction endodeoxyribonuclease RuvC